MTIRDQVLAFHRAFGCPVGETPHVPSDERVRLRLRLIVEEAFELLDASLADDHGQNRALDRVREQLDALVEALPVQVDLPEFADALADIDYVCEGARLEFGIDGAPIAAEVQRSNLSKLSDDGKPVLRADGKITKGPNFSPPDIAGELRKQGWRG